MRRRARPSPAHAERLKELATIQGVRDNPLIGYGLVVGLDGTGDQTMQTPFTTQSLNNMLQQLGITIPAGVNMQLKNVAAVMVTATLPPFARPGQSIDVTVSSMGNAKSLRGGTLLMTPLKGVGRRGLRHRAGQHGGRRRRRVGQRQQGADQPAQLGPHPGRRAGRARRSRRRWAARAA